MPSGSTPRNLTVREVGGDAVEDTCVGQPSRAGKTDIWFDAGMLRGPWNAAGQPNSERWTILSARQADHRGSLPV